MRRRTPRAVRAVSLAAGVLVAATARPSIVLRLHVAVVEGHPREVGDRLRARLESGDVLVSETDALVARFAGRAGHLPFRTIELVTFSDGEVGFEHLAGSFHACREKFVLLDEGGGRTRVEHSGTFTMRGGLIGWVAGRLVVRRLFEAHVAEHMRGFGGK